MSDVTEQHDQAPDTDEQVPADAEDQVESDSWVTLLAWSPDGSLLATGSTDGDARIVEAGSGEVRYRLQLDGAICALAWSPDGSLLAVAGTGGHACIADAAAGEVRHQLLHDSPGGDVASRSGIERGDEQLADLQDHIDKVRAQTGQPRQEPGEAEDQQAQERAETSDSEVSPPG